jgi:hypothetical protein
MRRLAFVGLFCAATSLSAQGITLPSARVVGPSAAMRRLIQITDDGASWYPSDDTANRRTFELIRYRLLMASFTGDELKELACDPSWTNVWRRINTGQLRGGDPVLATAVQRSLDTRRERSEDASSVALLQFAIAGREDTVAGESLMEYLRRREAEAQRNAKSLTDDSTRLVRVRDSAVSPTLVAAARDSLRSFAYPQFRVQSIISGRVWADTSRRAKEARCKRLKPVPVSEDEAMFLPTLMADVDQDSPRRARLDTLARVARLVVIERKLGRVVMPVLTTDQARVFWRQNGVSPLNMAGVTGGGTTGAAFTELASPLLHAVRLSLSTVFASSNETPAAPTTPPAPAPVTGDATELTRFLSGGGQLNVGGAWPILFGRTSTGSIGGMLLFAPRLSGTLSALGATTEDANAFVDPAVELHVTSVDALEGVGFYAQVRTGHVVGGDGIKATFGTTRSKFEYAHVAAGLLFGNKYLLAAGKPIRGPASLMEREWQVGVTVLRSGN